MVSFLDSMAGWLDTNFWAALLVDASLKGALLLLAATAVVRLFRPASASVRHLIRALTLLALVLLPLCRLLVPPWQVEILPRSPWPDSTSLAVVLPAAPALEAVPKVSLPAPSEAAPGPLNAARSASTPALESPAPLPDARAIVLTGILRRWETALLLLWAAGAAFFLSRLLLGVVCVQYAKARSRPLDQDGWEGLALQARRRLNLRRSVRLHTKPGLEVALSVGVLRPMVLLPEVALTWSSARRRSILLHEFSHVKRWDNLTNLVAQLACALHWFNPLAWAAARRLTVDRERACDDEVLESGTKASDYAGHLLEIARAISSRRLWGRMEVSQSSVLKDRLHAVLDPRLNRRRPSIAGCLLGAALSAATLVPLSALQPWKDASGAWNSAAGDDEGSAGAALRRSGVQNPPLPLATVSETAAEEKAEIDDETRREQFQSLLRLARPGSLQARSSAVDSAPTAASDSTRIPGWSKIADVFKRWTEAPPPFSPPAATTSRTSLFRLPVRGPRDNPPGNSGPPEPPVFEAEVARLDLGTLGGGESQALDINDLGLVVGESRKAGGLVRPFLWTAQTGMVDLAETVAETVGVHARAVKVNRNNQVLCETFNSNLFRGLMWSPADGLLDIGSLDSENPFTQPQAMNEAGMVVGGTRDPAGRLRAFAWTPVGGMLDLGVPGDSVAWAVNNRGQVAGYTEQTFMLGVETRAFFWDPGQGLHFLRPDGAPLSIATAVNNLGQVVGYAEFGGGYPHAFLWSLETGMVDLGVADPEYPITLATGINDLGQVVGQSIDTADPGQPRRVRAFRWTPETGMQDIGSSSGESRLAINAIGQIVGAYVLEYDGASQPAAFLWTEAGAVELQNSQSTVVAINNRSQAVGSSLTQGDERHAFLWEVKIRRRGPEAGAPTNSPPAPK